MASWRHEMERLEAELDAWSKPLRQQCGLTDEVVLSGEPNLDKWVAFRAAHTPEQLAHREYVTERRRHLWFMANDKHKLLSDAEFAADFELYRTLVLTEELIPPYDANTRTAVGTAMLFERLAMITSRLLLVEGQASALCADDHDKTKSVVAKTYEAVQALCSVSHMLVPREQDAQPAKREEDELALIRSALTADAAP